MNQNGKFGPETFLAKAHARLNEAETYMRQGLFAEAKEIYSSLLDSLEKTKESQDGESSGLRLEILAHVRKKLTETNELQNAFRKGEFVSKTVSDSNSGPYVFVQATAFKDLALFDEAIAHFKKAVDLGCRRADCLEEIGGVLIRKGNLDEGLAVLKKVYVSPNTQASQKSRILDKIALAYESSAADMRKTMEVYRELASLEKTSEKKEGGITAKEPVRARFSFSTITRFKWVSLAFSLLIACVLIAFNPNVELIENVDQFNVEGNPDSAFYKEFQELFGGDDFFVIAFQANDIFTYKKLTILRNLTEELEKIEEAKDVTSLYNVDNIVGYEDYFEVGRFIDEIPETVEKLKALENAAVRHPIYLDFLISRDGNFTAIIVETYHRPQDKSYRKRLFQKTRKILSRFEKDGVKFHLAGTSFTDFTLGQYMNEDMSVFVPATFILIAATVWFFFRNLSLTAAALVNIALCVGATRGFMGLTGLTLNMVTNIVIPLIMALALCDTVHIFSHMDGRIMDDAPERHEAMARVLSQVALPCFMTTLTTAVGFFALSISRIPPIREFAWAASAGMFFEFFFSFFFLPSLLLFFHPSKIYKVYDVHAGLSRVLHQSANLVNRKSGTVVVLSAALIAFSAWSATFIKVETNLIEFFKPKSPIRQATDFVETRLGGVGTFDISLKAEGENAFKEPANLAVIEKIQHFLGTIEGVDKTISFVDLLKDMNESFHNENPEFFRIPNSREMVAQYLLLYDSEDIEDFVNGTFDHARVSVRTSEHGSLRQKKMIDKVREFVEGMDRNNLDIRITGRTVNEINIVDDLVRGQMLSLGMASLIISLLMLFVFKSWRLAVLCMLPNFFPIIVNFGIMGVSGIPLDTGTALIAAVALGIAVDDTIHLLIEYQRQRLRGMSVSNSIKTATLVKGRAILSSSLILSIGFGVSMLSRFVPIVHFGILTALIMLTAVVGDLVVLPAIINLKKGETEKSMQSPLYPKADRHVTKPS